jgi:hypothetical protein
MVADKLAERTSSVTGGMLQFSTLLMIKMAGVIQKMLCQNLWQMMR